MKTATTTFATSCLLSLSLINQASAYIEVPIIKNGEVAAEQINPLGRRQRNSNMNSPSDRTVTEALVNARTQGLYYANISVGSPPQQLSLQVDTGSSDLWVPSSESTYCQKLRGCLGGSCTSTPKKLRGCLGGSFDSQKSSTFEVVGPNDFNISYVDNTGAQGSYFTDNLLVGERKLKAFQMGLAETTTIGIGIMGIGYSNSEVNIFTGNGTQYPNLPLALVNAGLINTPAYSLWLDDLNSSQGNIIFGGIDTAKYDGELQSLPVYPNARRQNVTSFTVAFTSLSATSSTGSDTLTPADFAHPAILDSGTTLTLLPDEIAAQVFTELGATVDPRLQSVLVPCALANNTGTLDFGFGGPGGPVIKVRMSELVLPLTLTSGKQPVFDDGTEACQLGIQAAGDLPTLFGDTFLRSAYVVYDLENSRVAIAQTRRGPKGTNIVEFESRGAAIPYAESATAQVTVSQTESGQVRGTNEPGAQTAVGTGGQPGNQAPTSTSGFIAASGFAENSRGFRIEPFNADLLVLLGCWSVLVGVGGGVFAWA